MGLWGYSVCDITLPVTQRDVWGYGDTVCDITLPVAGQFDSRSDPVMQRDVWGYIFV